MKIKSPQHYIGAAKRRVLRLGSLPMLNREGISFLKPNYLFFDQFTVDSIVLDVGCGHVAEFSVHMIETHGLKAYGVDPTRKHRPALAQLEGKFHNRFEHIPVAVGATPGSLTFNESEENESGSLRMDHRNVVNDNVVSYDVEVCTIPGLIERTSESRIEFLKLDLEGAEYDLIDNCSSADFSDIEQVFVEFHHHCIPAYSSADTLARVKTIESFGFRSWTIDDANFLFARP